MALIITTSFRPSGHPGFGGEQRALHRRPAGPAAHAGDIISFVVVVVVVVAISP